MLKYAGASMLSTTAGGVFDACRPVSIGVAATAPFGHSLSGEIASCFWRPLTAAMSLSPSSCVRFMTQTALVGERIVVIPMASGTDRFHPGPMTTKSCAAVPVVRFPGAAKTLVFASSISIT